jgi:hypothetical protein
MVRLYEGRHKITYTGQISSIYGQELGCEVACFSLSWKMHKCVGNTYASMRLWIEL